MRIVLLAAVLASAACVSTSTTTATRSPAAAPTAVPASPTAAPSATPTATPTPAPTRTEAAAPPTSCPSVRGGVASASRNLAAVRAAHQPGADRVVFDFGPGDLPPFVVEQATVFNGPSGQAVPVQGNVFLGVRFPQAGSMPSYLGPTSIRPATTVVREVKVTENFEGQLVFGIGLDRLVCPKVSELASPARLVLDLPSSP